MDPDRQIEEENIVRLIQAGFGNEARPNPHLKTRALRALIDEIRKDITPEPFPDLVIVALGGILTFAAVWFTSLILYRGVGVIDSGAITILFAWLGVNLVLSPATGLLILIRRRNDDQSN